MDEKKQRKMRIRYRATWTTISFICIWFFVHATFEFGFVMTKIAPKMCIRTSSQVQNVFELKDPRTRVVVLKVGEVTYFHDGKVYAGKVPLCYLEEEGETVGIAYFELFPGVVFRDGWLPVSPGIVVVHSIFICCLVICFIELLYLRPRLEKEKHVISITSEEYDKEAKEVY